MDDTRSTLLMRLKDRTDQAAWQAFDRLYRPLLFGYARTRGLEPADADDVTQQCVAAVLERIADYPHEGRFRTWLRAILDHKIHDHFRRRNREQQAESGLLTRQADVAAPLEEAWDRNWRTAHFRYCLERVREEVEENTYAAFLTYAVEERPAAEAAQRLGMTVNQIYVAKHRILERIGELLRELLGDEWREVQG